MVRLLDFPIIVSFLRGNELISNIEEIHLDEIAKRGFYKIKCRLTPSKYRLEIKFIKTQEEFIYSYQLYTTTAIMRWDNEPHFPNIKSHPHHFHDSQGNVLESELAGEPERDIEFVLSRIKEFIIS